MYDKLSSKELLTDNLQYQKDSLTIPDLVKILDKIIQTEYSSDYIPNQIKMKRRKRRRGLSN